MHYCTILVAAAYVFGGTIVWKTVTDVRCDRKRKRKWREKYVLCERVCVCSDRIYMKVNKINRKIKNKNKKPKKTKDQTK